MKADTATWALLIAEVYGGITARHRGKTVDTSGGKVPDSVLFHAATTVTNLHCGQTVWARTTPGTVYGQHGKQDAVF